jgi:hypothetical protein
MANDDQTSSIAPTLSFSVSTPHLVEALMHQERAEVIKICIMQIGDTPVLRIRNPGTSAVQDIGIDFQYGNTDDYTIQPSIGESVSYFDGFKSAILGYNCYCGSRNVECPFDGFKAYGKQICGMYFILNF